MKKIYFFIFTGVIITLLVGFWVYSFLFGSPTNDDSIFTNLGIFGQNNTEEIYTPPVTDETPVVDVAADQLRQLTTKPVLVGKILAQNDVSVMRYVEAGTGHIFDINLTTGSENRVSQISIPFASEAVISPSGDYVAVRSGYTNNNTLMLVDLTTETSPIETKLPNLVESFAFGYNNELLFTEFSLGQTEGRGYLPSTKTTRRLFSAPFTTHNMAWSNSSTSNHIIYTKPAASQLGYAYEITASGLKRLSISGFGLTVSQSNGVRFIGTLSGANYITTIGTRSGTFERSPAAVIPEKCTVSAREIDVYFCASPIRLQIANYPDVWYQGKYTFDDYLWAAKPGRSTLLVHPLQSLGRSLDIVDPQLSQDERMVYFINKTDKSLWLYEI